MPGWPWKSPRREGIIGSFSLTVWPIVEEEEEEDGRCYARIPSLKLWGQGSTPLEARDNLAGILATFVEDGLSRGTLFEVLEESGVPFDFRPAPKQGEPGIEPLANLDEAEAAKAREGLEFSFPFGLVNLGPSHAANVR